MASQLRQSIPVAVASILSLVGLWMIYELIRDGAISAEAGLAIITTLLGGAVSHLFASDAAGRAVGSYERAQNGVSDKINAAARAAGQNGTNGTAPGH
jgi:hypothetical protein